MGKLLIHLLPCGSDFSFPVIWKLLPVQLREFPSFYWAAPPGTVTMVRQSSSLPRMSAKSAFHRPHLQALRDRWCLGVLVVCTRVRLHRFPERISVYLLKLITAVATTAISYACLLSLSCLVTSPRRLSICQSPLPSRP